MTVDKPPIWLQYVYTQVSTVKISNNIQEIPIYKYNYCVALCSIGKVFSITVSLNTYV